jgi:hypothetical protein
MPIERVQKITEALYRVTEFFPDKEPLKWQLRCDAIEIFDFLMSSEDKKEIFRINNILFLIRKIERILQLTSSFGGYIPSINFEVLRREYLSLADSLQIQSRDQEKELYSSAIENILPASSPVSESNGHLPVVENNSNGHSLVDNGHNGQEGKYEENKESNNKVEENENENRNGQPILLKERKRKILNLVKENEWISIREILVSLPEFGPKSIQRDLLEMVEAGILKKTGDKRWRKYSLV